MRASIFRLRPMCSSLIVCKPTRRSCRSKWRDGCACPQVKRLKNLKKKEIEQRMALLQKVAGAAAPGGKVGLGAHGVVGQVWGVGDAAEGRQRGGAGWQGGVGRAWCGGASVGCGPRGAACGAF
eukprot:353939-Chlamydomonas_euryale.AAC.20